MDRPTLVPAGHDRHVRVIEEHRTFTPFGVRLWDWATNRPVAEGLTVDVRPAAGGRQTAARVTRSGIFAASGLPGMADVERPRADEDPTAGPTAAFLVRVGDTGGRFLPTGFTVDLPRLGTYPAAGDLAPINGASTQFPGFPLFSSACRTIPAGFAAIRADLRVDTGETDVNGRPILAPAAHAVLRVDVGSESWFGAADAAGSTLVLFPFPDFARQTGGGGAGAGGINPTDQQVDLTIAVRYGGLAADPWIGAPEFDQLRTQPAARFRPDATAAPVDTLSRSIAYGAQLVLTSDQLSELLIQAA